MYRLRDLIASHIACEDDCKKMPTGCGCALAAARAVMNAVPQAAPVPADSFLDDQHNAQLEGLAIGLEQRGEKSAAHCIRLALKRLTTTEPQEVQVLDFFSQSVDAWGALEWFDRLAKAVREQDKAVVAGDMMTMETCRNVASSSAMRLVRDYEPLVRAALALTRPE